MLYFLYPQLRKLSGAERLILRLAAYTVELGAPVTLVTNYLDPTCRPALAPRVRVVETGQRASLFHQHYLDAPLEYLYSLRLLEYLRVDAQAILFFGPPSLPALFWSKRIQRRPVPHLYFCYEPPRFIYDDTHEITARLGPAGLVARPFFALYKLLDRAMVSSADKMLGNSLFGVQRLRAAYGREATVITHGADLGPPEPALVEALRSRHDLRGKLVMLTVNFLHPRKRIDLFLRAVQLIHAQVPETVAFVVGSGPEEARLKALAAELQIQDAVIFAGFVPESELPAYYAVADLYLHTCKLESFGLSVLEASAAGVTVVAVGEGGPCEIIADGETGVLVPAVPEGIAATAVALLRDPARRRALGAAARLRVAQNYAWTRGAQTFLEIVRQM